MSTIVINGTAYNTTRTVIGTAFNETTHRWNLDGNDRYTIQMAVLRTSFCSAWLGLFVAVLLAFIVLSTPVQRRGPGFLVQCLSFTLAMVYNLMDVIIYYQRVVGIFNLASQPIDWNTWLNVHVANISFERIIPFIADTAVLFKIRSFYPSPLHSRVQRLLVIAPLIGLLIPRFALIIVLTYLVYREQSVVIWLNSHAFPSVMGFGWHKPMKIAFQIEYALGAVYCAYAATVLLTKAHQFSKRSAQVRRDAIRRRIRFFMEAMLMSFVPPMLFSVAALSTLECPPTKYCYYREMAGALVNTSVLFGLLATSWSSIRSANDHGSSRPDDRIWDESTNDKQKHSSSTSSFGRRGIAMPDALIHKLFNKDKSKQNSSENSQTDTGCGSSVNATNLVQLRPRNNEYLYDLGGEYGRFSHQGQASHGREEGEKLYSRNDKSTSGEMPAGANAFSTSPTSPLVLGELPHDAVTFHQSTSPRDLQRHFGQPSPPNRTTSFEHSVGRINNGSHTKTAKSFISFGGSATDIDEEEDWRNRDKSVH